MEANYSYKPTKGMGIKEDKLNAIIQVLGKQGCEMTIKNYCNLVDNSQDTLEDKAASIICLMPITNVMVFSLIVHQLRKGPDYDVEAIPQEYWLNNIAQRLIKTYPSECEKIIEQMYPQVHCPSKYKTHTLLIITSLQYMIDKYNYNIRQHNDNEIMCKLMEWSKAGGYIYNMI